MTVCVLGISSGLPARAQLDYSDQSTASWIGLESTTSGSNQWFTYRKSINLAENPGSAVFDIATDSKYWLWINGEMVVFEGGLKRGPTPNDSYFDRVDVTPYLRAGDNAVAILNWYFGKEGFSHHDSGKHGLILDGRIDGQVVVSDGSWRVARNNAYGTSTNQEITFRHPESNLRFDEAQDLGNWQAPFYDDSNWATANVLGSPGDEPWNHLIERNIPQWKDYGLKSLSTGSFVSAGQQITYSLPYHSQFTPYFKISVPHSATGQTVTMLTETNNQSQARGEYVVAPGVHEYESYGWNSGEKLKITFPAGVTVLDVGYRETGFNTEFIDRFVGDDGRINALLDKGARTLYVNMRDNYMDTPDRERAAWWGDIVNELGQSFYTFDRSAHSLIRKSVLNLADWSHPDGRLSSPVPSVIWGDELPMQMLASVGHYGFANYYRHSGDVETISHVYPKVNDYVMNVWQMGQNGLLDTGRLSGTPNLWAWFDWGDNIDRDPIANAWYYLALKGQREQALASGNVGDIPAIDQRMHSIEANFENAFWDATEQAYLSPQHGNNGSMPDDRANALAVLSGLAPNTRYAAIRELLVKIEESSPYMEIYAAKALAEMGYAADGLLRLRRRYADQIDADYSTLWERFDPDPPLFPGTDLYPTRNHGWNAPLTFFAEHVTGIKPLTAGFEIFEVSPNFAGLNAARQHVDTVKGALDVVMIRTDAAGPTAGYQLSLRAPAGTQAKVSLPLDGIRSFNEVLVNGQVVYEGGVPTNISGFTYIGVSEGLLEYEAVPGDWEIEVVGQQAGYFSTRSWQGDADLPLDGSKTYTHAIDFSPGGTFNQTLPGTTTIGGVEFTKESLGSGFTYNSSIGGQDNVTGAGWSIDGIEFAYEGNGSHAPGVAGSELSDGLVAGGETVVLELTNLAPYTDYVLTWFSPLWNASTDRVGILDGSDDGLGQGMSIAVVQDANAESLITQYRYNTGNSTVFQMQFENLTPGETLHHYAFINELATELIASLPPISGDADGNGVIDLDDFYLINDNLFNNVPFGTRGDVNNDGVVNVRDYRLWKDKYEAIVGDSAPPATQVPETHSVLILCLLAAGLTVVRTPPNFRR
jgi:alpha-L-rhamnosidase